LRILFYGARQAGIIAMLTVKALGHNIVAVVPDKKDEVLGPAAKAVGMKILSLESLNSESTIKKLRKLDLDLIICCHGRQILSEETLSIPKKGSVNIHPCLYKFPGARPIKRLLESGETKASVAVHVMTGKVDKGRVICEKFIDVSDCKIEVEVYNKLYPLYSSCLAKALKTIGK